VQPAPPPQVEPPPQTKTTVSPAPSPKPATTEASDPIAPVPTPVLEPTPAPPTAPPTAPAPAATTPTATAPAPGEPPPTAPPPPALEKENNEFVKGELTHLGIDRFITKRTRILVSAGYNQIGDTSYVLVYPQFGLKVGDFAVGVGAPLNIEVFSSAYPKDPAPGKNHIIQFANAGTIRKEDWDQPSDWARVLTYLSYGKKEDHFYVDVSQQHASTIGHGAIMRRYNGNIDVNFFREGLQVDAYNDYAGAEIMTNDVMRWSIMSGLVFVKPLSFFLDSWLARSVSLGVTAAVDREAPLSLQFEPEPSCPVPNGCAKANVPAVDDHNQLMTNTGVVALGGLDLEMKIVKTENVDIKPYVDYSRFFTTGVPNAASSSVDKGGGFTVGVLGRFNAGKEPTHAFRLVAELRLLQEGYRAGYFDTFYEVDKVLMMGTGGVLPGKGQIPVTKIAATACVKGDPANATNPACTNRTGYYLEASYGVTDAFGITVALQGDTASASKDFVAHLEIPWLSWLQLFGTLYVRGFEDFGSLFTFDKNAMALAGIRIKPLPILFINLKAYKTFQLDAYEGKNGPLGSLQYQSVVGFAGDIGLGWEF